jgi:16S rRNA (guanine966-N2)-methyltransferase
VVRVIGGAARGRSLKAKIPFAVRPTTDYAREAIFSMLESRGGLTDLVVADLYCGTGAMGIEALSRGAARVYFYDSDPECLAAARANLEPLGLAGEAHYVRATLPAWRAPADLDLVLCDPPYGPFDVEGLLRGVHARRVVVENDRFTDAPAGWAITKTKRYGTTLVTMLEPAEGGDE